MKKETVFGVIGHPIAHSMSPAMHNAVFEELDLGYRYEKFDVAPNDLKKRIGDFQKEGFLGLNVTIPHKVEVRNFLTESSQEANVIGAVNTIKFEGKKVIGYNTDGIGCVAALRESGVKLADQNVLVLGAGGAGRAIVAQCLFEKACVAVTDYLSKKAYNLAIQLSEKAGGIAIAVENDSATLKPIIEKTDVLINASPVGMHPNVAETPIDPKLLHEDLTVMDIIYNPLETSLLRQAKAAGCATVDGLGMFVHQGAASLKIWLGIDAPIEVMRKTVEKHLKEGIVEDNNI
ncbi:MAG: shikimate dehydrogenase [Candidatus Altiarchaeota archaeon]